MLLDSAFLLLLEEHLIQERARALIEVSETNVSVTVTNYGSSTATFNVTIYLFWEGWGTSGTITFIDVTLPAGNSTTLTAGLDGGMYGCDLSVKASFTQGEITVSSSTVAAGTVSAVQLALPEDVHAGPSNNEAKYSRAH
jgi:hypothetical protein